MINRPETRLCLIIAMVFLVAAIKEPRFVQAQAIQSILLWIPILSVMAIGQMFVIASRGIDVSIGSILGFCGISLGLVFKLNPAFPPALAIGLALGIGVMLGLINGILIAYANIPPIITTLGTLSVYRGATFWLSHGDQVDGNFIPRAITNWSLEGPCRIGDVSIPWLLIFAVFVALIGELIARWTPAGRNVFAIGSNPEAAHLRGVPVRRMTMLVYALCGALAGLAGILYMSRYGFVNPGTAGLGMELSVIAATVIGGCDVRGGRGTIAGVLLGGILLGTLNVALAVIGIAADWQLLVYGLTIVLSLCLNAFTARRSEAA